MNKLGFFLHFSTSKVEFRCFMFCKRRSYHVSFFLILKLFLFLGDIADSMFDNNRLRKLLFIHVKCRYICITLSNKWYVKTKKDRRKYLLCETRPRLNTHDSNKG